MIPKVIHCCWLGDKPKTRLVKACQDSWRKFAPDWTVREWTMDEIKKASESGRLPPIPKFFYDAAKSRKWAFAADWLRFSALLSEGGVYLDCDVELLKPLTASGEFVAGQWMPNGNVGLEPAVMALEKNNAIASAMVEFYDSASFDANRTTGEIMEEVIARNGFSIEVRPPEVFCPIDINGRCHKTENTVGIHHYAMSWVSGRRKLAQWLSWHGMRPLVDMLLQLRHKMRQNSPTTRPVQPSAARQGSMKILFVWTGVTSYMADCWRRLQQLEGVDLRVVVEQVDSGKAFDVESTLGGIDYTLVSDRESSCEAALGRILNDRSWTPDVVFAVGWHSRLVRSVVQQRNWAHIPKVCCFDMPWRWSLRCIAARWALHPFLKRFSAAYVPGHVCATYARWLGFRRIEKGLFAIDTLRFRRLRDTTGRKCFLYVGRFSAEKRVDIVRKAHERYLSLGGTWGIDMYGQGGNFIQAGDMPRIYAEHACLVLASEFDPWPLVVPEALSAGCDVVMSDRCGNRFELPGARVVHFGDVEAMAREMLNVEREWNGRGGRADPKTETNILTDISPYDCGTWAERTIRLAAELTGEKTA